MDVSDEVQEKKKRLKPKRLEIRLKMWQHIAGVKPPEKRRQEESCGGIQPKRKF